MDKHGYAYLLASARHGTLYTGVTSDLMRRISQHRDGTFKGFTDRYDVKCLVWYEAHASIEPAIIREKRIKEWKRDWKVRLIEETNPDWHDLAPSLGFPPLTVKPVKPFKTVD
nr:GIY-YIG nuclease family protein [Polymorphobacter sp.]